MHIFKNIRVHSRELLPANEAQIIDLKKKLRGINNEDIVSINASIIKSLILRIELDHKKQ